MPGEIAIKLDDDSLELLAKVVAERVAVQLAETQAANGSGDRLTWTEAEAAERIGLNVHQLRDARYRGEISYCEGPRGRILYRQEHLNEYLAAREHKKRN